MSFKTIGECKFCNKSITNNMNFVSFINEDKIKAHHQCYKNDYYNSKQKNLRVPKFNREIEADRVFTLVKDKNNYHSNVETTCHTDFRRHKSHSVYKGLNKPEVKEM